MPVTQALLTDADRRRRRLKCVLLVGDHLQLSWDVVKGIAGDDLQRRFAKPKLRSLKRIAIDEIYLGKKHKFLTIVMDLDSGRIVFVGDGKGRKSLEPFWRRLKHSRAMIAAVAADLSPAYSAAIRKNLPNAQLVFDRFVLWPVLRVDDAISSTLTFEFIEFAFDVI